MRSPKPPFYETALLSPSDLGSLTPSDDAQEVPLNSTQGPLCLDLKLLHGTDAKRPVVKLDVKRTSGCDGEATDH